MSKNNELKACIQVSFEIMVPVDKIFHHGNGYPEDGFVDSKSVITAIKEYRLERLAESLDITLTMSHIGQWLEGLNIDEEADLDVTIWQGNEQLYDGRKRPA